MLFKPFGIIFLLLIITGNAYADDIVFAKKSLKIVTANGTSHKFIVEIADNPAKQEYGLMNRKTMNENHGMLFLFARPKEVNMWMKDTYIPLDIIFVKKDSTILKIVGNSVPMSLDTISSNGPVISVVELNAGICKKFGIKKHDKVVF